jgi:hypothetical protein
MENKKKSIFSKIKAKILGKKHDFVVKKNKFLLSEDWKAIKTIVGETLLYGVFLTGGYLGFTSSNLIIKGLGLGAGFWIFKEKILQVLIDLFNSISLVRVYR